MDELLQTLDNTDEAIDNFARAAKGYVKAFFICGDALQKIAETDHPDEAQEMAQDALKAIKDILDAKWTANQPSSEVSDGNG